MRYVFDTMHTVVKPLDSAFCQGRFLRAYLRRTKKAALCISTAFARCGDYSKGSFGSGGPPPPSPPMTAALLCDDTKIPDGVFSGCSILYTSEDKRAAKEMC